MGQVRLVGSGATLANGRANAQRKTTPLREIHRLGRARPLSIRCSVPSRSRYWRFSAAATCSTTSSARALVSTPCRAKSRSSQACETGASGGAQFRAQRGVGGDLHGGGLQRGGLITGGDEAVLTVPDELARGGVVEAGDRETARHGFGEHVAEGLGQTGVNVDVGRRVVAADFFAGVEAREDAVRVLLDQ